MALDRILVGIASLTFVCAAMLAGPNDASAITVEVARKCQALTSKAFPPREPGNPAAGSAKGSGLDQQSYFKNQLKPTPWHPRKCPLTIRNLTNFWLPFFSRYFSPF